MHYTWTQAEFFQNVKQRLPQHLSLAEWLCEVLHVSEDSAYRRIRGDKQITLDELQEICLQLRMSADQALGLSSNHILFSGQYIRPEQFDFAAYLKAQKAELSFIASQQQKEIIFLCKDIPVYHYFLFPEIASFKYFSWMRTLLNFPELRQQKFSLSFMKEQIVQEGTKLAELYYQIPGVEILNSDNILTTLRQIEYFKDARLFETEGDLDRIYESLDKMVDHLQHMASEGLKFLPGKEPGFSPGTYRLYTNEFYVGDNTLLVTTGSQKLCFIVHSGTNFVRTADAAFCSYHDQFIKDLIKRSTLISEVGERERNAFFTMIKNRIQAYRENSVPTLGNI